MQEPKTQQFSKFYIKDIKIKLKGDHNKKKSFIELGFSNLN